jgi:hypothetical protein
MTNDQWICVGGTEVMWLARATSFDLLAAAGTLMLVALFFQNVTLASGDYRGVLLISAVCAVFANVLSVVLFLRGAWGRWVSLLFVFPTLFILFDFLRRAPDVW